jgi:transcriptional regulator
MRPHYKFRMYKPIYTSPQEKQQIVDLISDYPFVTLISKDFEGPLSISHIPVVTEFQNQELKSISGHFAIRNPQVEHLKQNSAVTLIFQGPHTYITPLWYKSGRDVPTWNYCVVHVHGELKFDTSFEAICTNLKALTKKFELGPNAWEFELPDDLDNPEALTSAIVAFTVVPKNIEAKFKLGQNRQLIDRQGVVDGLNSRVDDMSKAIQKLMKQGL